MARTSEGKTYRRVPEDVEEVAHIAALIQADVTARAPELATKMETLGELQKLLNWREKWQGILSDLREEAEAEEEEVKPSEAAVHAMRTAVNQRRSAAKANTGGAAAAPADETK